MYFWRKACECYWYGFLPSSSMYGSIAISYLLRQCSNINKTKLDLIGTQGELWRFWVRIFTFDHIYREKFSEFWILIFLRKHIEHPILPIFLGYLLVFLFFFLHLDEHSDSGDDDHIDCGDDDDDVILAIMMKMIVSNYKSYQWLA